MVSSRPASLLPWLLLCYLGSRLREGGEEGRGGVGEGGRRAGLQERDDVSNCIQLQKFVCLRGSKPALDMAVVGSLRGREKQKSISQEVGSG